MGGTAAGAQSSLESLARQMRNPGVQSMIKALGVATEANGKRRDSVDILTDLGKALAKMPRVQADQYAQILGIDDTTLSALIKGPQKFADEYKKLQKDVGADNEKAAEQAQKLMTSYRELLATLDTIITKIAGELSEPLSKAMNEFGEWLKEHQGEIKEAVEGIAKAVIEVAKALAGLAKELKPVWQGFDELARSLTGQSGLTVAFEALGVVLALKVLKPLAEISKLILGLGSMPAWLAGLIGAGTAVGIAAGESETVNEQGLIKALKGEESTIGRLSRELSEEKKKERAAKGIPEPPKDGRSIWQRVAPSWLGGKDKPGSSAPIKQGAFKEKAPGVMQRLMEDFGLTKEQAAGIVGNLGHESAGFKKLQEENPTVPGSRGGYGWAQWTGPRRRQFEAWAKEKGLDPASDEANYGFLKHELQTSESGALKAVKKATSVQEAMLKFEQAYERAGVKHYASRQAYAEKAVAAYDSQGQNKQEDYWTWLGKNLPGMSAQASTLNESANNIALAPSIPSIANDNSRAVSLSQKTDINVFGGNGDTAAEVVRHQSMVNSGLVRNMQGAVR